MVVGYGTQLRRDLTGNVATVTGKEIATSPVQSFDQALQGRAPGVNITTPNGVLNNPPVIRMRGTNSMNLSSAPLVVIDGIPAYSGNSSAVGSVPNNPLSNLNPNDIESMEVLKDASATAIYGSRAAGGVILVTTKKGKKGQSHLNYDTWAGWSKPVRLYDVLGAKDYVNIKNEAVRNLNANRTSVGAPATNVEGFKLADANGDACRYPLVRLHLPHGLFAVAQPELFGRHRKNHLLLLGGLHQPEGHAGAQRLPARLGPRERGPQGVQPPHGGHARGLLQHPQLLAQLGLGGRRGLWHGRPGPPAAGAAAQRCAYNPDGSFNTSGAGLGPGPNINPSSRPARPCCRATTTRWWT